MNTQVSVLPTGPFDVAYAYNAETELSAGTIVNVPFGNRSSLGIVLDEPITTDKQLKNINKAYSFRLPEVSITFMNWVARYSMYSRGKILKMVIAEPSMFSMKPRKNEPALEEVVFDIYDIELSENQHRAYEEIRSNSTKPVLLYGVTGSGKTEVYLKIVQNIIRDDGQVLILFPEIALTQQMINRIQKYFGIEPLIWNSAISKKERKKILRYVNSEESCIVIGSRSALFLPFSNLSLIVVDEEHDGSYKQESGVLYNARDMAVVRAKIGNIPIILSSATPSLETYANVKSGKYACVKLHNRFGNSHMPYVEIVDLRTNRGKSLLSIRLQEQIQEVLRNKEQILLYVNRRGYAPITVCKKCGFKVECPNCSALLINYKSKSQLVCNYCGHKCDIPKICPQCVEESEFVTYGAGVEKVYEEVQCRYPNARTIIASSDTMDSVDNVKKIIDDIVACNVDIIIATQILAKGHHFQNLTTVGIIDGDAGLDVADIRASERTFQLLNQVIGRAGREEKLGKIYIQTFDPKNIIFDMVKNNAIDSFLEYEINSRREYSLPPFSHMIAIIISGNNAELVEKMSKELVRNRIPGVTILGPAPAVMSKISGRTRWRILLKSLARNGFQYEVQKWLHKAKISKAVTVQIDVDPMNFL